MRYVLILAAMILFAPAAQAGNFCVAGIGLAPQCFYDDINQCLEAAEPPNTNCILAEQAILRYSGGADYCMVMSDGTAMCIFTDRSQCDSEAYDKNAICIRREERRGVNDPFRYDNRIQD